jgi:hypothetical protein
MCFDYYHVMACPEWEELDSEIDTHDQFRPDWRDIHKREHYTRPQWFAQGTLSTCLDYLYARRSGNFDLASKLWQELCQQAMCLSNRNLDPLEKDLTGNLYSTASNRYSTTVQSLLKSGQLLRTDLVPYDGWIERFGRLFDCYDLIHANGVDGFMPLLTGHRYVAFEHGTLRTIPFQDDAMGRRCRATYEHADFCLITNPDNFREVVPKLSLKACSFIPHPIDEEVLLESSGIRALRATLQRKLCADRLVFLPARHHWKPMRELLGTEDDRNWDKGNDIFIRGLYRHIQTIDPRIGVVTANWGQTVAASKALISALGLDKKILWVEPMPHRRMMRYIAACDALADQFMLSSLGGTPAKALIAGKPAITRFLPGTTEGCFAEPPPLCHAESPDDIAFLLHELTEGRLDTAHHDRQRWYERYHSSTVVTDGLCAAYQRVLSQPLPAT